MNLWKPRRAILPSSALCGDQTPIPSLHGVYSAMCGRWCKVWSLVSTECRACSLQNVEHVLHRMRSYIGKIAFLDSSAKYGAWFRKVLKVISTKYGTLQSVEAAPQHAKLGKIALLGFHMN